MARLLILILVMSATLYCCNLPVICPEFPGEIEVLGDSCVAPCSVSVKLLDNTKSVSSFSYSWDIKGNEEGESIQTMNALFPFKAPGVYQGKLNVICNQSEETKSISFSVNILAPDSVKACFEIDSVINNYIAPTTICFSANCSKLVGNNSYEWSASGTASIDSFSVSKNEVKINFPDEGSYNVILKVTDLGGNTSQEEKTIIINPSPTFQKCYGGINDEEGYDISESNDGYLISGRIEDKAYILNVDLEGEFVIDNNLVINKSGAKKATGIFKSGSREFTVIGLIGPSSSEAFATRINTNGVIISNPENFTDIASVNNLSKTSNGHFLVTGRTTTNNNPGGGVYFLHINSLGEGQNVPYNVFGWQNLDEGFDAIETNSQEYIVVGKTFNGINLDDFYILKLNNNYEKVWDSVIDFNQSNKNDELRAIAETENGFIVTGISDSRALILEIDQTGTINGFANFLTNESSEAVDIEVITEGPNANQIFVLGTLRPQALNSQIFLAICDKDGNLIELIKYEENTIASKMIITKDRGVAIVGTKRNGSGNSSDIFMIKTDSNGLIQ